MTSSLHAVAWTATLFILASTFVSVNGFSCQGKGGGFHPDPKDCNKYYRCVHGQAHHSSCTAGLVWNSKINGCDWGSCTKSGGNVPTTNKGDEEKIEKPDTRINVAPPVSPPRSSSSNGGGQCKRVVCYFTNWAQYRANGKQMPSDLKDTKCTHIIHSFAKVSNGKLATVEWNDVALMKGLVDLKRSNPGLKILIAVGGWTHASKGFSPMAASRSSRKVFIDSVIDFLRKYNLDGLDLDWEYPTKRGGSPADKPNFTALCKELKEALSPHGYLVTAAVAAGTSTVRQAYDIPGISRHLDFINLMTYDLHGSWDSNKRNLYHHSALYKKDRSDMMDVDGAVQLWLSGGAPSDKLVLGVPFYAKTYTLSPDGKKQTGSGTKGPVTGEAGMLSYYEVCDKIKGGTSSQSKDSERGPYAVVGNQWMGYDDPATISRKTEYALSKGLGGVMLWDTSLDDFTGNHCGQGTYPLLKAITRKCGM